jgi:hypothetical protein
MTSFIYSADPGLIIGFHGCEQAVCNAIISGKQSMKISNNTWDWLGDGIYFWQNNYERAWHYANNPPGKVKIKKPAVLGAVFSLGNCLDLTDKKSLDIVKAIYELYAQPFTSGGKEMPKNVNPAGDQNSNDNIIRRLDCSVIKEVHEYFHSTGHAPFDSVRALFAEGDRLYKGAGFMEKTHIQVAIRNPNMIKGYFLPRKEIYWSGAPLPFVKTNPPTYRLYYK